MFNPFVKFETRFINTFRDTKRRYLVSQTFSRQHDLFKEPDKEYLMFTHYTDPGLAKIHHNAVIKDKSSGLYDLDGKSGECDPHSPFYADHVCRYKLTPFAGVN